MEFQNKRVSVAMATYNGEKYIKEQIESILINLKENDELIISDDGSTDHTIEIINSINDSRIKLLEGPKKGIKQNFNNAIKASTGDYIFLSDQDDIWMPNKVEKVLEVFENNDYILIQHDAIIVDGKENVIIDSFFEHRKVKTGIIKNLIKNSYHGCCIAFKKELKSEILPIPDNIYLHDQWIGMIAEVNGKTFFLNEKLMKYRRYEDNNSSFVHLPVMKMLTNRIEYLMELCRYMLKRRKNEKHLYH